MKKYIKLLFIVLISALVKSNDNSEASTIRNDVSELKSIKQAKPQCYAYCFNIVQPLLQHTVSLKVKEQQIQEQNDIIKDLEHQLAASQTKVAVLEESTKNKDIFIGKLESRINETLANPLASSCIGKLTDVYNIKVPGIEPFSVPCDSSLADSGWTVIQRRKDGSENFNRNWTDYRLGFGNFSGEFFIGLEKLHRMTKSQAHELYIYLEDFKNETRFARYSKFLIGGEEESYKIKMLGEYSGNAGDALERHKNKMFSTPDRDNDDSAINCAQHFVSGWWFDNCYMCNLNGVYNFRDHFSEGFKWTEWHLKPLKFTQMMIRPKSN